MSAAEKTISFRADAEKIDTLGSLAAAQDRTRTYLINEAITSYIELHDLPGRAGSQAVGRDAKRSLRQP